jgi:ribosome-binding protein aMBF1 (putative translation factor)
LWQNIGTPSSRSIDDGSGDISGYNQYGFSQLTPTLLGVQDIQREIGATIRELRRKRKLSQDVFAERSGLHRAHVGEIERGESNVTIQTLKIIADTLQVRIVDLVRKL